MKKTITVSFDGDAEPDDLNYRLARYFGQLADGATADEAAADVELTITVKG